MGNTKFNVSLILTIVLALALGYVITISLDSTDIPNLQVTGARLVSDPVPSDWISENQIKVFRNKVELDIDDPQWVTFTPTNSMTPLLSDKAHAIEVVPESEEQLGVGDIVAYERANGDVILHRIVEIGEDNDGKYFIFQGDNVPYKDPGRVRFSQIRGVVVAVIY